MPLTFGVVSTANIARVVVPAIGDTDHEVLAVGSRDPDRAQAFAEEFGIERAYGSYEALLDDGDLDAVYNPLPNALHAEWTVAAADRDLDVLCEKPLAVDAAEARRMGEACRERGVTLMEAFMYRYHPRTERVAELVADWDVRAVDATFQFPLRGRPEDVRLSAELAGGSLMDVGCYAVNFARLVMGEPDRVRAHAHDARDCGVETHLAGVLEYDDGRHATVTSSFDTADVQEYRVDADRAVLSAEEVFVPRGDDGVGIEYEVGDGRGGRRVTESFDPTDQYRLQVEHFADCVADGRSPRTDADEAVRNVAVLDALAGSADRGEAVPVTLPD